MFLKKSDRLALVDFQDNKTNYTELINQIKYYSKHIITDKQNSRFKLILVENRKEWILVFFAIWDRGYTPIIVDALSNEEELIYFIEDAKPESIIVSNNTKEVALKAIEKTGKNIDILNLDDININEEELKLIEKEEFELNHPNDENTALMLYTSGTTGSPKGVMLSYNNIIHEIKAIQSLKITYDDEQILAVLPFHHILPLMTSVLYFLYHEHSYSIVLLEKLNSQEILNKLSKNRVTILSAVPRLYKMFYKSISDKINAKISTKLIYGLMKKLNNKKASRIIFKKVHETFGGHLRTFIAGGGRSDVDMIEFFDTIGIDYCEGYGLTETAPVVAGNTPNHGKKLGTVGKCSDNVELKVVDGELWIKGPMVMKGYYNKPEKTSEVITEDGWLKSGDLASIDEEGYITILGRKNSMIVLSNGKNIDPETLEDRVMEKSDGLIKEIGIFNRNDKLTAIIVPNIDELRKRNLNNTHAYIKDIVELYNSTAHNYAKILDFKLIEEELPKTRVGKLRRFMLPDMYTSDIKKKIIESEPDTAEYKILKRYIEKMKSTIAGPDDNFELEMGLDSLDQAELITYVINSFNIKMVEEDLLNNANLRLLSEFVRKKSDSFTDTQVDWSNIVKNAPIKEMKKGYLNIFLKPIIWIVFKLYFRIKIDNKKKIKNKTQIFIANHESFIDSLALGLLIPNTMSTKTYFLAIDWYFKSAFMKFFADNGNVILLDIDRNIKDSVETLASAIKQGKSIFIFPEGTRTKTGELSKFKKVFAILSKELNTDIQCLGIEGAYEAYSRFMKFPRPKKIKVKVLDSITPKGSYEDIVDKAEEIFREFKKEKNENSI